MWVETSYIQRKIYELPLHVMNEGHGNVIEDNVDGLFLVIEIDSCHMK